MYIYIYIYIYRRVGGEFSREIVFVSFVRACERARRGEAKLCAGVRRGAS